MTMSRERLRAILVLLFASAAMFGCTSPDDQATMSWTPPVLTGTDAEWQEPNAREVLGRMTDFLASHQLLMTEALVSYESVQESGQKLQFDFLQRMAIQRPDKFFWTTVHDDGSADSAWFVDGQFTLLRQPANVWGQIDGPHTIPAMVDRLISEYDLDVPFPEILGLAPGTPMVDADAEAWWVGEAWVEGHWTNHIAIRDAGVDIQVWVRKGDQPFPAKLAFTFMNEEGQPTYVARFRRWSTSVPNAGAQFTFTPPPDAERIDVVPVISR
jgi:hypothetical protein